MNQDKIYNMIRRLWQWCRYKFFSYRKNMLKFYSLDLSPQLKYTRRTMENSLIKCNIIGELFNKTRKYLYDYNKALYITKRTKLLIYDTYRDNTKILKKLYTSPLNIITINGINGIGKSSTAVKLAHHLSNSGIVGADIFRAAGVTQIQEMCHQYNIKFVSPKAKKSKGVIVKGIEELINHGCKNIIIDLAGRFFDRKDLLDEVKTCHQSITNYLAFKNISANVNHILVVDVNLGHIAIKQGKNFPNISGFITTKVDHNMPVGIIPSLMNECNIPCLFITTGKNVENIEQCTIDTIFNRL